MPEYLAPGVYVEEVPSGIKPIEGVSTSTAGFLGRTERGPTEVNFVDSFLEYQRLYGGFVAQPADMYLPHAVKGFFDNGGKRAYIARVVKDKAREASTKENLGIFTVTAKGPGRWGTRVYVLLQPSEQKPAEGGQAYRLTVAYFKQDPFAWVNPFAPAEEVLKKNLSRTRPDEFEDFDNLRNADEIVSVVKARSRLITISRSAGAAVGPLVAPANIKEPTFEWPRLKLAGSPTIETKITTGQAAVGSSLAISTAAWTLQDYLSRSETIAGNTKKATAKLSGLLGDAGLDGGVKADATTVVQKVEAALTGLEPILKAISDIPAPAREVAKATRLTAELDATGAELASGDAATGVDALNAKLTAIGDGQAISTAIDEAVTAAAGAKSKAKALADDAKKKAAVVAEAAEDVSKKFADEAKALIDAIKTLKTEIPLAKGRASAAATAEKNVTGEDDPNIPADYKAAIEKLNLVDDVSILVAPEHIVDKSLDGELVNSCEILRDRVTLLSAGKGEQDIKTLRPSKDSTYAAFYYPWIKITDPLSKGTTSQSLEVPAVGHIAGILARSDINRGVHKAPANEVVQGALDLGAIVSKERQDVLNPRSVNCIRDFTSSNRGIRLWGARTTSSDSEWKYLNVRRLFLFIEKSIDHGTQWVVFEPNSDPTWAAVRRNVSNFLTSVWRSGALFGTTAEQAFFVRCDRTTMTEDDIQNGRLICVIGVAPVRPAEFVIFRISQKTLDAQA
jgi:phage tail sheath protein FI